VTDATLDEVANVYREHAGGGAPTKAVAEHFAVADSTASLYLRRARDAGKDLGPPPPRGRPRQPRPERT
jgi:transposase